jgi:hypothetical protein
MKLIEKLFKYFGFERPAPVISISYNSGVETYTTTITVPQTYSVEEVLSWRLKHGWSMGELAKRSGLKVREIERLEKNWKKCSLAFLPAIAKAYGMGVFAPSFDLVDKAQTD